MDNYNENLWEQDLKQSALKTTENVITLTRNQCKYLKQSTDGKVFGRFGKIKLIGGLDTVGEIISKMFTQQTIIDTVDDGDIDPTFIEDSCNSTEIKNANELYRISRYGFELYNREYKFRVFEIEIPPLFPIETIVDEGIMDSETRPLLENYGSYQEEKNSFLINEYSDYKEFLRIILNSKKVQYIISKLCEK